MATSLTIDERGESGDWLAGCRPDPLHDRTLASPLPAKRRRQSADAKRPPHRPPAGRNVAGSPAGLRLRAQLPGFAPLLEELEIAGWSAQRQPSAANFHDWLLVGGDRILVTVGHAVRPGHADVDAAEATLVVQAVWAAIRALAPQMSDAGALLSRVAQSLWPQSADAVQVCVGAALLDTAGGQLNIALAGECLAWRVRAASCDQFARQQPPLGASLDGTYLGQSLQLSLRERLVMVASDAAHHVPPLDQAIAASFSHLDAESHRRMTALDAVSLARKTAELDFLGDDDPSLSIAAVRRR